MKIYCIKTPAGFAPLDLDGFGEMSIGNGDLVQVDVSRPRNPAFHRKFFAMLKHTMPMTDTHLNMEQWRTLVTCGAGYCDFAENHKGEMMAVPRSISFAKMDEDQFSEFYGNCLQFICDNYVDSEPEQLATLLEFM